MGLGLKIEIRYLIYGYSIKNYETVNSCRYSGLRHLIKKLSVPREKSFFYRKQMNIHVDIQCNRIVASLVGK